MPPPSAAAVCRFGFDCCRHSSLNTVVICVDIGLGPISLDQPCVHNQTYNKGTSEQERTGPPECMQTRDTYPTCLYKLCIHFVILSSQAQPPPRPPGRSSGLLHVCTRGDQHKSAERKLALQWPTRPYVPFCHKSETRRCPRTHHRADNKRQNRSGRLPTTETQINLISCPGRPMVSFGKVGVWRGWGGYCRLQMPLSLALGVRQTLAGHRLGALKGVGGTCHHTGGGVPPALPMHPSTHLLQPPA